MQIEVIFTLTVSFRSVTSHVKFSRHFVSAVLPLPWVIEFKKIS